MREAYSQLQSDIQLLQDFDNLQYLVTEFTSIVYDAYLQQFVDLTALTIVASSITSQTVHLRLVSPTTSIILTTNFFHPHTQTVTQTSSPTTSTHLNSSTIHHPPPPLPIMVARYDPLVPLAPLPPMPQDYQSKIPQFYGTCPTTYK